MLWKSTNRINFKVKSSPRRLFYFYYNGDAAYSTAGGDLNTAYTLQFDGDNFFSWKMSAYKWYKVHFQAFIIWLFIFIKFLIFISDENYSNQRLTKQQLRCESTVGKWTCPWNQLYLPNLWFRPGIVYCWRLHASPWRNKKFLLYQKLGFFA